MKSPENPFGIPRNLRVWSLSQWQWSRGEGRWTDERDRMKLRISVLLVQGVLLAGACGETQAGTKDSAPSQIPTVQVIEASPTKGFNYPYLLRVPTNASPTSAHVLLVEPNNTGK